MMPPANSVPWEMARLLGASGFGVGINFTVGVCLYFVPAEREPCETKNNLGATPGIVKLGRCDMSRHMTVPVPPEGEVTPAPGAENPLRNSPTLI